VDKKIKKYLEEKSQEIAEEFQEYCEDVFIDHKIESSIEQLFFIELHYQLEGFNAEPREASKFYIIPQYEIITKEGERYRVDFLIYYTENVFWMNSREDYPQYHKDKVLLIELDSFLWHGQTPEQFEQEKKRERDLMNEDYKIMRFSGREIVRDVEKCVEEAIAYFNDERK
jgi:hypothetical protein